MGAVWVGVNSEHPPKSNYLSFIYHVYCILYKCVI